MPAAPTTGNTQTIAAKTGEGTAPDPATRSPEANASKLAYLTWEADSKTVYT